MAAVAQHPVAEVLVVDGAEAARMGHQVVGDDAAHRRGHQRQQQPAAAMARAEFRSRSTSRMAVEGVVEDAARARAALRIEPSPPVRRGLRAARRRSAEPAAVPRRVGDVDRCSDPARCRAPQRVGEGQQELQRPLDERDRRHLAAVARPGRRVARRRAGWCPARSASRRRTGRPGRDCRLGSSPARHVRIGASGSVVARSSSA